MNITKCNINKLFFLVLGYLLSFTTIMAQDWTQLGGDINGDNHGDSLGYSVSLSSDGLRLAIGIPNNDATATDVGQVRVYQYINGIWTQIGLNINGEASGNKFGTSVSLNADGSILAVGAPFNNGNGSPDAGHVRIYRYINNVWMQIGHDIDGEVQYNNAGHSVSLSSNGSIVAVGAPHSDSYKGQVRVFQNINNVWTQIGANIEGEQAYDHLGSSLSLSSDGSIIAIGATLNGGNGVSSGFVRVFQNNNGSWTQIGQNIDGEGQGDKFGLSVSLNSDGSIVAIGAPLNDGNGTDAGKVRVYENINGLWTQIGQDIVGEIPYDELGYSVSLSSDGSIVAIGAPYSDSGSIRNTGQVRVYRNISGVWTLINQNINGENQYNGLGRSVSLNFDGSTVAIGIPDYSNLSVPTASLIGQVKVFNDPSLGISSQSVNNISIYPIPTSDILNFDFADNKIKGINIIDITGKQIYSTSNNQINKSIYQIDLSDFKTGIYIIKVQMDKNNYVTKIIKE